MIQNENLSNSDLGKPVTYSANYDSNKLFAIPRHEKRAEIGINHELPFYGYDLWNHYEVSWLNQKGKPVVALAEISYPADSVNIVESKSLKLYFNSLNNTHFVNEKAVAEIISSDLENIIQSKVEVKIIPLLSIQENLIVPHFEGFNLDSLDINCSNYEVMPSLLTIATNKVEETLNSNLLKANCLITNQPDWASVQIHYQGPQINHEGLLAYLISFRNHNEFHEQCIERIFVDIMSNCKPETLSIYGRFTRRGGLDINPFRSTQPCKKPYANWRLIRQ